MTESSRRPELPLDLRSGGCDDSDLQEQTPSGGNLDARLPNAELSDSGRLSAADFDACYQKYAPGLRAALRARLKNDLDVEDCLNRVFEKLWLHGHQVAPAARRSWLFVVSRNEAALIGRGVARRLFEQAGNSERQTIGAGDASHLDWQSQSSMPLDKMLHEEQLDRLRRAGQQLSEPQKQILRCRFDDDLTFREISERLQIPLGTALTRLRTAILNLKKMLDET